VKFEVAVVEDIVLDVNSKYFADAGEWNGIGTITFKKVKGPSRRGSGFAKPYFSNFSNFPLKNELVYIFTLPSPDIQEDNTREVYYYLSPISIWNSQHHNAIPNIFENTNIPESQRQDYQQTSLGSIRKVTDGSTDINLGNYFRESTNTKPLKKFEGDVIVESRVGSSLRFGTTSIQNGQPLSNWSTGSFNGQPITILRNGQGQQGSVGFLPTEENINNDNSSIYLTNGQQIPLEPSSTNDYYSYNRKPQPAKDFRGDQIILNSGRLFFNSKTDSIFLSSNRTINLNSVLSVNVDTEDLIVQSTKIYLGSKNAKEPVLYGDKTVEMLGDIINLLESLLTASATATAGPFPVSTLNATGTLQATAIQYLKQNLEYLKSETVYIE
jgi:hypothetical protein